MNVEAQARRPGSALNRVTAGFFNTRFEQPCLPHPRHLVNWVFTGIAPTSALSPPCAKLLFPRILGVVLAERAPHQAGPEYVQPASLYNIEKPFSAGSIA